MVTNPIRGSRIWRRRSALISSFKRSPTRSARDMPSAPLRGSFPSGKAVAVDHHIDAVVHEEGLPVSFDVIHDLVEHLIHHAALVAHAGHGQRRPLPLLEVADFGDGDVEPVLHPILDAPQDLPLVLEGGGLWDPQFQPTGAHDHGPSTPYRAERHGSRIRGSSRTWRRLQLGGDRDQLVHLDQVPHLNVAEVQEADAAFVATLYLPDILLEAAQRGDLARG